MVREMIEVVSNKVRRVVERLYHYFISDHTSRFLNNNPLTWLPVDLLWNLHSLKSLNLTGGVIISNIDTRMFSQNKRLTHL